MTTETALDSADVLLRLDATEPNPDDVPGLSFNQRMALEEQGARRSGFASAIRSTLSRLEKPARQLSELEPALAKVAAAKTELERRLADAPDWRAMSDSRARDKEWGRQQGLTASLNALERGVEFFDGFPSVPAALCELLGETAMNDGRRLPNWYGSLPHIERRVAELRNTVAALNSELERRVSAADTFLTS